MTFVRKERQLNILVENIVSNEIPTEIIDSRPLGNTIFLYINT